MLVAEAKCSEELLLISVGGHLGESGKKTDPEKVNLLY